ncbi:LacI family DNA-binding transcriptional regulator [Hutsoniella sourekii]|uniref:LacI family DNA-binding transcriptional regulator n=1 Tax=Hutsoniella sourekii TaxID=87650 RepID=UPI0004AEACA1|nr:LacI family DNA-binding transcriptional regulator [Hutsoniella sourekii]
MPNNKVTINDVAERVGVSKTTISRYINGNYKKMSLETKKRIQEVIEELDYHPNRQAQSLKSDRSYLIGVIVADIGNLYTAYILEAMFEQVQDTDYQLIILNSNNSLKEERRAIQRLLNHNIEALILQPVSSNLSDYDLLTNRSFPITLLDRSLKQSSWSVVQSDNLTRTEELAGLIISKGYQRVIHFSEPVEEVSPRFERYTAMKATLAGSQVDFDLHELTNPLDQIHQVIDHLDWQIKTAFFAANGNVLQQLLRVINQCERSYPGDCGVCGYDDWHIGDIVNPKLTAVQQDPHALGKRIIQLTFNQLEGQPSRRIEEVKAKLVIGESL